MAGNGAGRLRGRHGRGGAFGRGNRQLLLDRLEFRQRPAELFALGDIVDRHVQGALHRRCHLHRADGEDQRFDSATGDIGLRGLLCQMA